MFTYSEKFKMVEPNTSLCATERIIDELSRCSINKIACKHGLYASETTTYCLHPDHLKFRNTFL